MGHKKRKSKNVWQILGILILFGSSLWFFLSYASIAPNSLPLLQIGEPLPNQTDVSITYFVEINNNQFIIYTPESDTNSNFLDATGMITGLIVGVILIGISKVVNKR